jgi:hypothetical protein
MGLMRWLRGGEENSAAAGVISAGLAEIDALFRPTTHKQTEHIQESRRRRVDLSNGTGIDLDGGLAVIRRPGGTDDPGKAEPPGTVGTPRDGEAPRDA